MKEKTYVVKLTETAIMLAVSTVLSLFKLIDLPFGGSVTIASMLPMIIIAYRHGLKWGLLGGLASGIVQQLLGLNTLSWVTTWQSIVAVIMLDYILAFTAQGFGGIFKKKTEQNKALVLGSFLVCLIRYICHVISGATVWAGLSIPDNAALMYSLSYNATYMIPETIVTMIVAYYLGSMLDFRNLRIGRMPSQDPDENMMLKWLAGLLVGVVVIIDTVLVFSKLQNPETGDFDIKGLSQVNWTVLIVITVVAAAAAIVIALASRKKKTAVRHENES